MAGDVKVAVVSGQIATGTIGFTDFTKSGFGTPKACIVLVSFDTVDDANVAGEGKASIGFSTFGGANTQFCIAHQDEDASAKVDCDTRKSNVRCYMVLSVDSGLVQINGTASTITDGVRLTNTGNLFDVQPFATVIMFGGADLQVSLDKVSTPNSVGGTTVVATSIDQDLVFFIGLDISAEESSSSGINSSFGVAHIDTADHTTFVNRCMGWSSDHNNAAGSPSAVLRNDRCLKILTEAAGDDWGIELTAATTTSYTITERDVVSGANMEIYALALDLDDRKSKVGSVDSPTSGATWTPAVALGFTPQYVGLGVTHAQVEGTIETDADAGGQGISSNAGSGEETFHGWYNEDAAATINTNNNFRSRALDFRDDDVTTVVHDHSHSSFDSGGWTYTINTENETTARKWFYWAIEQAPSGATATGAQTLPSVSQAGVGVMQPSAAGAMTLPSAAQAGAGEEEFTATGAMTLPSVVQDAVGVMQPSATGAMTLPSATQAGAGEQEFVGSGAMTLPSVVQDAAGVMQPSATGAMTLPSVTQIGAGEEKLIGSGIMTLPSVTQVGTGKEKFTATGAMTLPSVVQDAAGVMQPSATGAMTLPSVTQVGAGEEKFTATGAMTLPSVVQDAVGVMQPSATGAMTLPSATQAGASEQEFVGSGAMTLPSVVQDAVGVMQSSAAGTMTLPSVTQVGAGTHTVTVTATGGQTLPSVTQNGVGVMQPSATGVVTLPSVTQIGAGEEKLIGSGAMTLPSVTQVGAGEEEFVGSGAMTLPSVVQDAVGVMQPSATGAQTLPSVAQAGAGEQEFVGSGASILAAVTQSGIGVMLPSATGAMTLPSATQIGAGEEVFTATGVLTLPSVVQSGVGEEVFAATGAMTLPSVVQDGAGVHTVAGLTGTGAQTLPSVNALASAIEISFVLEFIPVLSTAADIAVVRAADVTVGSGGSIGT